MIIEDENLFNALWATLSKEQKRVLEIWMLECAQFLIDDKEGHIEDEQFPWDLGEAWQLCKEESE